MSDPIADTTAPEQSSQAALDALSPADRASWDLTGDWPEPAKVTTTVDPDADEHDEPAPVSVPVAVDAKPEPTPEKPVSKRQQQINDLIRKETESSLRARALEAKLAALEGQVAPKEPEANPEPVSDPGDPEPQEASFEDYRQFVKQQARWEIRQAKREADAETQQTQRAHAETAQREAFQTQAQTWIGRRDDFLAKHPAKAERMTAFLDLVHPGTPIGDVILESEVGADVAEYLSAHLDEADRIARLAPISALRALGKLEAQFDPSLTSASASAGPAAKTVTSAPAPAMTLSSRSASPADPAAAALARGDFSAWELEENRKALASG